MTADLERDYDRVVQMLLERGLPPRVIRTIAEQRAIREDMMRALEPELFRPRLRLVWDRDAQ